MNTVRYYFPSVIEDDALSILAVLAKDLLKDNIKVVEMFMNNIQTLYGRSHKRLIFLMKHNNKHIFSVSSSSGNNSPVSKSSSRPSTPVTRNPGNFHREHLPLDAKEKASHSGTFEITSHVGCQTTVASPKKKAATILNPSVDEIANVDDCSSEAGSQGSPSSTELTLMTANLTLEEKELGSPSELGNESDANNQEYPRSTEITKMAAGLTTVATDTSLVLTTNEDYTLGTSNQESPRSSEIIRMTAGLTEASKCLFREDEMTKNSVLESNSQEKEGERTDEFDSINTETVSSSEDVGVIPNQTTIENETPSPVNMRSITSTNIQALTRSIVKVGITNSSLEDIQGDQMKIGEVNEGNEVESRQRKSPTPKRKNTTLFKSIPRVIEWDEADIDIEVSCDLENSYSPSPPRSTDFSTDIPATATSPKDISTPVASTSKTDNSPETIEWFLSPSEREISPGTSRNVYETNSPSERTIFNSSPRTLSRANSSGSDDDNMFFVNDQSVKPPIVATATRGQSHKSNSSSTDIEIDSAVLAQAMLKFDTLLCLRDRIMQKIFDSTLEFHNQVQFLIAYVRNIIHIVQKIAFSDKEYITKELKEVVNHILTIASKLQKKLTSWRTDLELDVNTFQKCFQQIKQLKAQYEPIRSNQDIPQVAFEIMQVYEYDVKAIWKRVDEMVIMADLRRASFEQTDDDFEKLMRLFPKCLILVGILLPR